MPVCRLSDDAGGVRRAGPTAARRSRGRSANTFYRLPLAPPSEFAAASSRRKAEKKKERPQERSAAAKDKEKEGREEGRGRAEAAARGRDDRDRSSAVPRAAPPGSFVLRSARVVTMKGDAVLDERRRLRHGQPHRGRRSRRARSRSRRERRSSTPRARPSSPASSTPTPTCTTRASSSSRRPKWEYVANLAYGVTTAYDPSAPSLDVFAQAEMVEAGLMIGPARLLLGRRALRRPAGRHLRRGQQPQADAKHQVRRMKAYGARMIKVYQQPRRSQRDLLRRGLPRRAHAADRRGRRRAAAPT